MHTYIFNLFSFKNKDFQTLTFTEMFLKHHQNQNCHNVIITDNNHISNNFPSMTIVVPQNTFNEIFLIYYF